MGLSLVLSEEASMSLPHALSEFLSRPNGKPPASSLINDLVSKIPSCVFHLFYFLDRLFGCPISKSIARQPFGVTKMLFLCLWWHLTLGVCHTTCSSLLLLLGQGWWPLQGAHRKFFIWSLWLLEITARYADGLAITWGKGDLDEYRGVRP